MALVLEYNPMALAFLEYISVKIKECHMCCVLQSRLGTVLIA